MTVWLWQIVKRLHFSGQRTCFHLNFEYWMLILLPSKIKGMEVQVLHEILSTIYSLISCVKNAKYELKI